MPIPESQLETWSHQGSITQSSNTYNAIKSVLEANTTPYAGKNFKVFLQGSYGNDTNIYAESDVDIMVTFEPGSAPGLGFVELKEELQQLFGRPVDLVTRKAIETSHNPYRKDSILSTAKVIYEKRAA